MATHTLRIGFIGTGNIGQPIIRSLMRSGFQVSIWNRTAARYADLVAEGATAKATPRELAASSDVVIAMLMEPANLDAQLDGPDGILAGIQPGSVFIDMATSPPRHAQWLAEKFAAKSVASLDTPVQGGVRAAVEGTLTVMVGGERAAYERVLPVLQAIGKLIVYVGGPGTGQMTKLCHQIVVAVTLEGLAESFALAKTFGADLSAVHEVLSAGFSAGPLLKSVAPRMMSRDWKPGRPLWMYEKDRANLADSVKGTGLDLPVAHEVFERMYSLISNGKSDLDEMALFTLHDPD